MLFVALIGRAFSSESQMVHEIDPGETIGELAARLRHPEWDAHEDLQTFVGRDQVGPSHVPADGSIVVIGPRVAGGVGIALAVITLAGTAYGYWRSKQQMSAQKRAQELREHRPYGFDTPALTAYGEGFRIPIVYGEMRTGGVVIGSRLEQSNLIRFGTELVLLVALSEGPVESIGGLTLDPTGEADYLTGATYVSNGLPDPRFPFNTWQFPAGLRINGFDADPKTVAVSLRKGRLSQSPLPDWAGAEVAVDIGGSTLTTAGQSTSYTTSETDIWGVTAELFLPEGLWFSGSGGTIHGRQITFEIAHRVVGAGSWVGRNVTFTADPPVLNPFSYFVDFQVFPAGSGPFELRITRLDAANNSTGSVHNSFLWKSAQIRYGGGFEYSFAYPGLALMSVRMPATEQVNGSVTNVSIPLRGRRVKSYVNATLGWLTEAWGVVSPWSFPVGNNPAWTFVDLCLDKRYGLGHLITESNLDLDAFRDWADLCDQPHPLDAGQPLLRYDGVVQDGANAIEQLARMAASGRAIPILASGNRIGVKFSHRDEFSRGSGSSLNVVPARAPSSVVTSSGVSNWEATYADPSTSPVVMDMQVLDASADYTIRTISGEDAYANTANNGADPITRTPRREAIEGFGVTRRIQAAYEIQLQHNFNRLSRVQVKASLPLDSAQFEVGDLVIWQNDALLSGGSATQSARTTNAGTVSSLTLSKPVTVTGATPRTAFGIWLKDSGGVVREFTADLDSPGTIAAGDPLPLWDPVGMTGASVSLQRGAQVALGPYATARRLFEVLSTSTAQDMRREIVAAEWVGAMFDVPDDLAGDAGLGPSVDLPAAQDLTSSVAVAVQGVISAGGQFRTSSSIAFAPAAASLALGRRARVYGRTTDGWFSLLGETITDRLENLTLRPGGTYEVHVCRENGEGQFPLPGLVTPTTVTIPEFGSAPPGDVERLSARVTLDRVVLEWPHVDDSIWYEVRRGAAYYGAEVLYQGRHNRYELVAPPIGPATYRVRARGASGLYSTTDATAAATFAVVSEVESLDALASDVSGGTASDVEWSVTFGGATLSSGETTGTWTSGEMDVEKDSLLYWSALATIWAEDIGDPSDFTLGAPAGHWGLLGGREPTRVYPGHDFDDSPATIPVDELGYADPSATANVLGQWVRVLLETRFYVDGAWGDWQAHEPGRRLAQKMQARLRLDRYALDILPLVKDLHLAAGF